jgi:hypothetical protein
VNVDAALEQELVERFAQTVVRVAELSHSHVQDLQSSAHFAARPPEIVCVCDLTGSTERSSWDGTREAALTFATEAGNNTAWLITHTPHYGWLRGKG